MYGATQKALEALVEELLRGFGAEIGRCDRISHGDEIGLTPVKYLTFVNGGEGGGPPCQPTQGSRHIQHPKITPPFFDK